MKYVPQKDDDEVTTILVTKRIRRKVGMVTTGNEKLRDGLERVLDEKIKSL